MASLLDQLRKMTTVVADTGDIGTIEKLKPVDCTTNPSLLLKAASMEGLAPVVDEAVTWGKAQGGDTEAVVQAVADRLAVSVGVELTKLVPGRVSTEVDSNISFNTERTLEKARAIIHAYDERGVSRDRVLIKIASTWEGIQAARVLQREGVDCNLTLLFHLAQAMACADAGVFLISPFVGRITDWYAKAEDKTYTGEDDPGVQSVRAIYAAYKSRGIETAVMGASFRNVSQIQALAGCDRLTISPKLLDELAATQGTLTRALSPEAYGEPPEVHNIDEFSFRWEMNESAMATEKLAEGIRQFGGDLRALHGLIREKLARG